MRLRTKLFLWIALVFILTLGWMGYTSLALVEEIVIDQTLASMKISTYHSASEIDRWFESRRMLLTAIAKDFENEKYEPTHPLLLAKMHSLKERFPGFFEFIYIGFEDKHMISTRSTPLPSGFDPTVRPWFKEAMNKNNFIITEPYRDRLTGNLVASLAMPVTTSIPGVLAIDVDLDDMTELSKKAIFCSNMDVILLSQNNVVLYSTNQAIEAIGNPLGPVSYSFLDSFFPIRQKDAPSYFQISRGNTNYVVFFSPINSANWRIAVAIPTSVLFAEQSNLAKRFFLIALFALASVFLTIYWIINKITQPLSNLAHTAHTLESGDLTVRFQASESFEATHLAESLDKMRSKLLGTIEEKDELLEETTAQNQEIQTLYNQLKALNADLSRSYNEKSVLYTQTISALSAAIEAKDPYTHGHGARVLLYSEVMGAALKWDQKAMENLRYAAILHDIGKIGIPENILNKPSSLSPEEYDAVKTHPEVGAKILQIIPHFEDISQAILHHHEHFSGQGYPHGISGNSISPLARVLAIADAYDAMISTRPYRPPLSVEQAYEELHKCAGTQFDPEIVKVFCKSLPDFEEIIKKKKPLQH